jgi:formate hydrogenlyase subunit 6/NADH:ubiquinone oxidoreductase subunit I
MMDVFEVRDFTVFLEQLSEDSELIAPIKRGVARFEHVKKEHVKDIYLEKNTYFPVKDYFFKKREIIFDFNKNGIQMPKLEHPKRVFFGIRRCDLNGIMHQDRVFTETVKDPYYAAQRENSILIGYHCNEAPSKYCFCGTLDLKDFYDVMFYHRDSKWLAEVGTEKGAALIKKYASLFKKTEFVISAEDKKIKNADRLLKPNIEGLYNHPDWKKGVDKCLSCAACTNLCPTCYCFDFHDELKTDGSGSRVREWSSCQLQDFTRVAGDHVFRQKREDRFKHRIYHQLQYFKDKYGEHLCVGCGRCIEGCPTRIDFVGIINDMR